MAWWRAAFERRMAPTEGVDAEPREEVEIPLTLGIEEVGAFASDIEAIEADRLEHPSKLVIQVLLMKRVVLPVPGSEQLAHIECHASPSRLCTGCPHKVVAESQARPSLRSG